ncbi:MAG: thioesterase family protein [Solirubrobacteraceae bacterium]|nr:thioesterase family protein [Solirubrobacteraceae bacterium]
MTTPAPASAYFESLGHGRYRATEHTEGPWSSLAQHGGPPCALLTRALEGLDPRPDAMLSRISVEFLRPVPVGELEVRATVERPGRSVQLLSAEMLAGGTPVLAARAWQVQRSEVTAGPPEPTPAQLPPTASAPPPQIADRGYLRSIEWRAAAGDWLEPGPAAVWGRPRLPLIEGETMTGLQRLMTVVDSSSGISSALPWDGWLFINTDLTVHVAREPRGDWILLDAVTRVAEGGVGLATAAVGDADGMLGRSAQTLLVRPTPAAG